MSPRTPDRFSPRPVRGLADLSDVRLEFGDWLRSIGVHAELVSDLLVVVSELCANAVRESAPGSDLPTLAAWTEDGDLLVEVSNEVDVAPHEIRPDWDLDDPLRTGGRGLLVVSALVDDVDVEVDGRRLSVRCSVSVGSDQRDSTVT